MEFDQMHIFCNNNYSHKTTLGTRKECVFKISGKKHHFAFAITCVDKSKKLSSVKYSKGDNFFCRHFSPMFIKIYCIVFEDRIDHLYL